MSEMKAKPPSLVVEAIGFVQFWFLCGFACLDLRRLRCSGGA